MDGWAYGKNLSTGFDGVFPLGLTLPCRSKFTLIHSSNMPLLGIDIIRACELAYPSLLTVYSAPRFDKSGIQEIVAPLWDTTDINQQSCIVCGSNEMVSMVVDAMLPFSTEIKILGSET